ncbi:hypothetical protein [Emticicia sp. 17c]|uniref:hypothetical protein n=1 Tax=Emticicia sp. 17c TaxID=3127704 RepID=UPI00301D7B0B
MKKIVSLIPLLFLINFLSLARPIADSLDNDIIKKYVEYGSSQLKQMILQNHENDLRGESSKNKYIIRFDDFWKITSGEGYFKAIHPISGFRDIELNISLIQKNIVLNSLSKPQIYIGLDGFLGNFYWGNGIVPGKYSFKDLEKFASEKSKLNVSLIKENYEKIYEDIFRLVGVTPASNKGMIVIYSGLAVGYEYDGSITTQTQSWFCNATPQKTVTGAVTEWNKIINGVFDGTFSRQINKTDAITIYNKLDEFSTRIFNALNGSLVTLDCENINDAQQKILELPITEPDKMLSLLKSIKSKSCFAAFNIETRKHILNTFKNSKTLTDGNTFYNILFDAGGEENVVVATLRTAKVDDYQSLIDYFKSNNYENLKYYLSELNSDHFFIGDNNYFEFVKLLSVMVAQRASLEDIQAIPYERTFFYTDEELKSAGFNPFISTTTTESSCITTLNRSYSEFNVSLDLFRDANEIPNARVITKIYNVTETTSTNSCNSSIGDDSNTSRTLLSESSPDFIAPFDLVFLTPTDGTVLGETLSGADEQILMTGIMLACIKDGQDARFLKNYIVNVASFFGIKSNINTITSPAKSLFRKSIAALEAAWTTSQTFGVNFPSYNTFLKDNLGNTGYSLYNELGYIFLGYHVGSFGVSKISQALPAQWQTKAQQLKDIARTKFNGMRTASKGTPYEVAVMNFFKFVEKLTDYNFNLGANPTFSVRTTINALDDFKANGGFFQKIPDEALNNSFEAYLNKIGRTLDDVLIDPNKKSIYNAFANEIAIDEYTIKAMVGYLKNPATYEIQIIDSYFKASKEAQRAYQLNRWFAKGWEHLATNGMGAHNAEILKIEFTSLLIDHHKILSPDPVKLELIFGSISKDLTGSGDDFFKSLAKSENRFLSKAIYNTDDLVLHLTTLNRFSKYQEIFNEFRVALNESELNEFIANCKNMTESELSITNLVNDIRNQPVSIIKTWKTEKFLFKKSYVEKPAEPISNVSINAPYLSQKNAILAKMNVLTTPNTANLPAGSGTAVAVGAYTDDAAITLRVETNGAGFGDKINHPDYQSLINSIEFKPIRAKINFLNWIREDHVKGSGMMFKDFLGSGITEGKLTATGLSGWHAEVKTMAGLAHDHIIPQSQYQKIVVMVGNINKNNGLPFVKSTFCRCPMCFYLTDGITLIWE